MISRVIYLFGQYKIIFFYIVFLNNVHESEAILGGRFADENSFKYFLSLRYHKLHICGATIISDNFALTAGHCLANKNFTLRFLKVTTSRLPKSMSRNDTTRSVVDWHTPDDYVELARGDIAVLQLDKSLNLKDNQQLSFAYLPRVVQSYVGSRLKFSGLGYDRMRDCIDSKTGEHTYCGDLGNNLKWVNVDIISYQDCQSRNIDIIHPNLICGIVEQRPEQVEGTCYGDSGGPLVFETPNFAVVVGVAINNPQDCRMTSFGTTFTRVASYLRFVQIYTNNHMSVI